jgi:DNA (cytosine-5)-methyltransferase 1
VRYLSLFSGIEACTQAWHPLGWLPVAFAEIEPFPCAVLAHHYPDVPNLGSVTDITDEQIKALGPIDLVVGGSPCQDLSVAGKRAGFDGERSSLFFEQMRIFHAARRLCGARWLLWENVPGAFSSNRGADFAAVVGEMAGCEFGVPRNGWKSAGVAVGPNGLCEWRVLDAQYFGLAQRRRRVFALLDTGDWHSRQPVLLEPESLRGDSTPSRESGEVAARWPADCAPTLNAAFGSKQGLEDQHALGGAGLFVPDIVGALTAKGPEAMGAPEIDANHYVCLPPTQDQIHSTDACQRAAVAFAQNQRGEIRTSDVVGALSSGGGKPGQGCPVVAFHAQAQADQLPTEGGRDTSISDPLTTSQRAAVAFQPRYARNGQGAPDTIAAPLMAQAGETGKGDSAQCTASPGMAVRRLTPRECERLQGFPDDFTQIPYRNKPAEKCPDGPRYKALGNSMAVPVMRWIGERIQAIAEQRTAA